MSKWILSRCEKVQSFNCRSCLSTVMAKYSLQQQLCETKVEALIMAHPLNSLGQMLNSVCTAVLTLWHLSLLCSMKWKTMWEGCQTHSDSTVLLLFVVWIQFPEYCYCVFHSMIDDVLYLYSKIFRLYKNKLLGQKHINIWPQKSNKITPFLRTGMAGHFK